MKRRIILTLVIAASICLFGYPGTSSPFQATNVPAAERAPQIVVVFAEGLQPTSDVLRAIREPTANHGLILGGLEGDREGTITVRSNVLGSGRVAKLTIHYDNRVH